MWNRNILSAASIIIASVLIIVAIFWLPMVFLETAFRPQPCVDRSFLYKISIFTLPAAFAAAARLLNRAALKHDRRRFSAACAIAAAAILFVWIAHLQDDNFQKACATRNWPEAVRVCKANPRHYRPSIGAYGNETYTLIPPGTTDAAWHCLGRWSEHNGSVSIEVDEEVYTRSRRSHSAISTASPL